MSNLDSLHRRNHDTGIRKLVLSLLLLSLLTVGCRSHYLITLNNGNRITTRGKPKFQNGYYRYRDINGQTNYVPDTKVQAIEPQRRGYTEESFKPSKR